MPADQALKKVRGLAGPSAGDGGSSLAWSARLEEAAAAIAPLLLIGGLALAGGGFGLSDRHIAGLVVWLLLAAMLVFGAASRATLARPFYWASGLIGALALFSAFSSLWSGSIELSVIEADRIVVYLGFFLAAFLIAQTGQARQRFGEGIALALIFVAALALASRLLPQILSVAEVSGAGSRLSYPLGYWNGDGVVFGIGAGLALWLGRHSLSTALRWIAVVSLPAVLLALYLTYSRGGLLALAIASGCLIALSRDRLWLLATLAIGAVGALPAVLFVQAHPSVAENLNDSHIAGQGLATLAILAGGTLLAAALTAGLRRLERREGLLTGRALAASRNPRVLRGIALAAALIAIGAAVAVGGRAWRQFSSNDVRPPSSPQEHLTQLSGSGRSEFWRVAIDAFDEKPLLGHGAGTYRISWHLLRHDSVANLDAHSIYLQAFAELGVVGGLLVLAMVGTLLWTGVVAWREARGPRRDLYAALLGASLAFAICSAIDWFWQIAAMGAIFFLASGVLVAARCAQLANARVDGDGQQGRRRYGLAIVGLVIAWIAAVALIGPLLVAHEIDASNSEVTEGNLASAVSDAEAARSIEPWATSPYKQLGLLAELQGNYPSAIAWLNKGIEREEKAGSSTTCGHESSTRRATKRRRGRTGAKHSGSTPKKSASTKGSKAANEQGLSNRARARGGHGPLCGRRRGAACGCGGRTAGAEPRRPGVAPPRRPAAAPPRLRRLDGVDRLAMRRHRGQRQHHCRDAFLGDAVQPDLDPRLQAPRPLRQRPPADPPQHPRRAALAGLGQLGGGAGPRRPAGAEPGRPPLPPQRDRGRGRGPRRQLRPARLPALPLAPADPGRRRDRDRAARGGRRGRAARLDPPGDAAGAGRLPLLADRADRRAAAAPGSVADISRLAREHAIERVVVTEEEMREPGAERLIEECKAAGLALTFLPRHYGLLGRGIELNRLAELPVLDFRFSDPPRSTIAMKRAMDVVGSAFLLLLLSPLLVLIALAILADSGRPVLFRQRRIGEAGKPFNVLKFRTMVTDAERRLPELIDLSTLDEPAFKIPDDPRVTRIGRRLRRSSFDELPQLLNVLRGDMSLVGPRPEEEAVVALYDERQRGRLAVKPGMTGPMQVYGRSDLTFEERLAMERDYLDNLSVLTDLAILLRTPRAMILGDGAY